MTSRADVLSLHLAQHGYAVPARRLLELSGGRLDQQSIVRIMRKEGLRMRCIAASADVLRGLAFPTLLELRSGALYIIEGIDGEGVLLRAGDDRLQQAPLRQLESEIACAFERLPADERPTSYAALLLARVAEQGGELVRLGLTVVVLSLLALLTSWLTREAVSGALGERSPSLLWTLVAALLLAACMRAWLGWLRARAAVTTEVRVVRATGPMILRWMLALPFAVQQQRGFAEQLAALNAAEAAARGKTALVVAPAVEGITVAVFLVGLLITDATVGCVLVLGGLLTTLVSYGLAGWRAKADIQAVRDAAETRERLHDLVQGIATIKAEHAERPVMLRWLSALLCERGACLTRDLRESWLSLWLLFAERALRLFVLCYGALAVMDATMGLADFIFLGLMAEGFCGSLSTSCRLLGTALSVRAHAPRVDAILPTGPEARACVPSAPAAPSDRPAIQLSDVWFRHGPEQPWILQGYDLTVREGEHLTLRGVSGMGKTTILRLIAGLYRPERGTVAVCGRDPSRDRRDVRYLPQQAQLFAGSIRDNLAQLSGASLARIMAAAERTGAADWLQSLPMSIETMVAAQGANLSGGQRQWLLLTAALASSHPVVLLDEAMSQMDHLLRARLRVPELFAGRTTLSVAHD